MKIFCVVCLSLLTLCQTTHSDDYGMTAPWDEHIASANTYVAEKKYSQAIDSYSRAIAMIEAASANPLSLYNTRGMAHFKNGNYQDAVSDFDFVVNHYERNPVPAKLPVAVQALWNRLGVNSRRGNVEKTKVDLEAIKQLDPNFPIVEFPDRDCITIKNLHLQNELEMKEVFSSVMKTLGICEKGEDIHISQEGIVQINVSSKFYDALDVAKSLECSECSENDFPVLASRGRNQSNPRVDQHKVIQCKKWCDDISFSLGLGCAFCPTPMGKAACTAAVYALKNGCHWCCSDGNFYKKCIQPLKAFNRDSVCDCQNSSGADRSRDDKDLIWDDPDLVYDWEDI